MKTIVCKFKSGNKVVEKTAVITDNLDKLYWYMNNEATEIIEPYKYAYLAWGLVFRVTDTLAYEVMFRYNLVNSFRTLNPIVAVTLCGPNFDRVKYSDWEGLNVIVK